MKTFYRLLKRAIPLILFMFSRTKQPERPNTVLFLADDMGYGDAHSLVSVCSPTIPKLAFPAILKETGYSTGSIPGETKITKKELWDEKMPDRTSRSFG